MKPTYSEQLRSPHWQRKRLERLDAAGWECENCGEKKNTLHVHHRQYFKDRLAWEYDDDELSVLCDSCHLIEHLHIDSLKRYLARAYTAEVLALVGGFYAFNDEFPLADPDAEKAAHSSAYAAGFIAAISYELTMEQMLMVAAFAASLSKPGSSSRTLFDSRGNVFWEESIEGDKNAEPNPS